jgi:CubicO group peptidase (beta-lactamase class C family)
MSMRSITGNASADSEDFASRRPALQAFLDRIVAVSGAPGICVALSIDGRRHSFRAGREAVDAPMEIRSGTQFELGCIAKTLTSVAALELAARGEFSIDAPIGKYVPELADDAKGAEVTVRHLMSHTVGYGAVKVLGDESSELTWEVLIESVRKAPRLFRPGTVFNYDHVCGVLLGRIIEKVADQPALRLVDRLLLEPLGVSAAEEGNQRRAIGHEFSEGTRSFSRASRDGPPQILGASVSDRAFSVEDLLSIVEMLQTGKSPATGQQILSDATLSWLGETIVQLPEFLGGRQPDALPRAYGTGLAIFAQEIRGSDGMGVGQNLTLRYCRSQGVAVVAGVNASGTRVPLVLTNALLRELGLVRGETRPTGRLPLTLGFDPSEIAGRYEGAADTHVVIDRSGSRATIEVRRLEGTVAVLGGSVNSDGTLTLDERQPISGIAFFADPASSVPCVQIGLHAYKRVVS